MDTTMAAVGWLAAGLLLLAYGLVSAGKISATGRRFQILNLFGAAGLAANSGYHTAWPSALLNVTWMVIGLGTMLRAVRSR